MKYGETATSPFVTNGDFLFMAKTKEEKKLIGDTVSFHRRRLGLSQKDLSKVVGISNVALSNIENGKSYPSAKVFKELSSSLGIKPIELLGDINGQKDINKNGKELLNELSKVLMSIYERELNIR
jgi:transcriptional regulator with XRE-family HTH domain